MNDAWNAMNYDAKDNLLAVVDREAQALFAMAGAPGVWEQPTACPEWQVRDIVGHLVDVIEGYFVAFDAARGVGEAAEARGLTGMGARLNERAVAHRGASQEEMMRRLRDDYARLMEIFQGLGKEDWAGMTVPHAYMGPLPAFFYPTFQLMDYTVHGWDIRQGTGRAHGINGDAADLLVPFMFILWQATTRADGDAEPISLGVRVSGRNGGNFRVDVGPEGLAYAAADSLDDVPAVIEFDPGSFVLTAFGRSNAGAIRGDTASADRYLNLFFRI